MSNKAVVLPPDKSLHQKIGSRRLSDIINKKDLAKADEAIDNRYDDFIEQVSEDMSVLDTALALAKAQPNETQAYQQLFDAAFRIKSLSGTFGYQLASAIAKQLYNFVEDRSSATTQELALLDAEVSALKAIFAHNIKGDGGETGRQIFMSIQEVAEKIS